MNKFILILTLLIVNCGFNGDQRLTQGGTSDTNINIVFEFINQVENLCKMDTLQSDYPTQVLYNKAVADCTFSKLSTINLGGLCNTPGLTSDQVTTCKGLGQ